MNNRREKIRKLKDQFRRANDHVKGVATRVWTVPKWQKDRMGRLVYPPQIYQKII